MGKKKHQQQLEAWDTYRNAVTENKNKSQDDFEKYINLLASGGLVLSLTFLEKIVSVKEPAGLWLFVLSLLGFVLTLLSNLYSHYQSIKDSDATIKEIDEQQYEQIFKNIDKRNKPINRLNRISIWSLISGTLLILIFLTINLFTMNNNTNNSSANNRPNSNPQPKPLTEEKGRTTPNPPRNNPNNNPKK